MYRAHSTISQAYQRRFLGNDMFQQIFKEIVRQAEAHGLISGRVLITDSTYIRANAKKKFDRVEVERVVGEIEGERGACRARKKSAEAQKDRKRAPAREGELYRPGSGLYVS